MRLECGTAPCPTWVKVGISIGWGFDNAPLSGSIESHAPWALRLTWGFDQDCAFYIHTKTVYSVVPSFCTLYLACAQCQIPCPPGYFLSNSPPKTGEGGAYN